jgi:hypothetical protein
LPGSADVGPCCGNVAESRVEQSHAGLPLRRQAALLDRASSVPTTDRTPWR